MMNTTEIQTRIDALATAMLAKGLKMPDPVVMIHANRQPTVFVQWGDYRDGDQVLNSCVADDLADAFDEADAFIASQPSPEEAHRTEFLNAVGRAVEVGRKYGIDSEFVNPLTEAMKRLSENIITYAA